MVGFINISISTIPPPDSPRIFYNPTGLIITNKKDSMVNSRVIRAGDISVWPSIHK